MIKALSAIAIAAFIAAATHHPARLCPAGRTSVPVALAKADRLDIRPVGRDCSEQAWPNFEASACVRRHQDSHHTRSPARNRRSSLSLPKYLPRYLNKIPAR